MDSLAGHNIWFPEVMGTLDDAYHQTNTQWDFTLNDPVSLDSFDLAGISPLEEYANTNRDLLPNHIERPYSHQEPFPIPAGSYVNPQPESFEFTYQEQQQRSPNMQRRISPQGDIPGFTGADRNEATINNTTTPDAPNSSPREKARFVCPFHYHDPETYSGSTWKACTTTEFDKISRLKEHIYRVHSSSPKSGRKSKAYHIDEAQKREMKQRMQGIPDQEKWNLIYGIIFGPSRGGGAVTATPPTAPAAERVSAPRSQLRRRRGQKQKQQQPPSRQDRKQQQHAPPSSHDLRDSSSTSSSSPPGGSGGGTTDFSVRDLEIWLRGRQTRSRGCGSGGGSGGGGDFLEEIRLFRLDMRRIAAAAALGGDNDDDDDEEYYEEDDEDEDMIY